MIPIIRKNTKDALIIVGTPTWSQDVDIAAEDPVTGYDNIMYAVHFYAATHTDNIRNKVTTALSKGLPIFVSEFPSAMHLEMVRLITIRQQNGLI